MKERGFLVLQKNGTPHDRKQLWTFVKALNEQAARLRKSKGRQKGKDALAKLMDTQFPTSLCFDNTEPPPSNQIPRGMN